MSKLLSTLLSLLIAILIFGGFISSYYFGNYNGTVIKHVGLFRFLSALAFLSGFLLIFVITRGRKSKANTEVNFYINNLKINGEKINVPFDDCEIKDNNYSEMVESEISKTARTLAGHSIYIDDSHSYELQNRSISVIVYNYTNPRSGQIEKFISPTIAKDRISLYVLLNEKKSTNIYVDKSDRTNYYFDLEFLNQ